MHSIRRLLSLSSELTKCHLIRNMSQMTNELMGKKLVWVDCEMTGLDVNTDRLLEIAVIVTTGNLDTVCQLSPISWPFN